jgi:DNA-binding response OmpR family regulator
VNRDRGQGEAFVAAAAGSRPLVLILDRDVDYSEKLAAELEAAGAQVEIASKGDEGLERAVALQPELVMLGLGLEPGREYLDLLPRLWEATAAPVLVLQEGPASRRRLEEAARAGAVACLSKGEVLPRAAARFAASQLAVLGRTASRFRRSGDVVLDVAGRSLRVGGKKVPLTRMQAEILAVLAEWLPANDDPARPLISLATVSPSLCTSNPLRRRSRFSRLISIQSTTSPTGAGARIPLISLLTPGKWLPLFMRPTAVRPGIVATIGPVGESRDY